MIACGTYYAQYPTHYPAMERPGMLRNETDMDRKVIVYTSSKNAFKIPNPKCKLNECKESSILPKLKLFF